MTLSPPNLSVLKQTSIPAFAPVHTSQELALISNDVHDTDTANDLNDYDMPPPALVNNPMVFKCADTSDVQICKCADVQINTYQIIVILFFI